MSLARQRTPRATRLDLVRRAGLLGCSYGHLARVIAGKRQSQRLLLRFQKLMEAESLENPNPPNQQQNAPKKINRYDKPTIGM
jgi:hypothetical protein